MAISSQKNVGRFLLNPIILAQPPVGPQDLRLAFSVSPCGSDAHDCKAPTNASPIKYHRFLSFLVLILIHVAATSAWDVGPVHMGHQLFVSLGSMSPSSPRIWLA